MDLVFWGLPSQKPECHSGVLCFLDSSPPNQPKPVTCAAPSLLLLCHLSTPALISPFPLQPLPPHPHRAATAIFLEHQTHPASSQLKTPQDPPVTQEHSEASPATPFSSRRTNYQGSSKLCHCWHLWDVPHIVFWGIPTALCRLKREIPSFQLGL